MVAQRPSNDLAVPAQNLGELSFDELMATELDETRGHDLVDKNELVGIPFVITSFTFRESDMAAVEYVSVEAITKDNQRIVFNDGSVGIRRDLVNYCVGGEFIIVHDTTKFDPNGSLQDMMNNEIIDLTEFIDVRFGPDGNFNATVHLPRGLFVKRGLRKSEYGASPDYDPKKGTGRPAGTTFYLA